ncbi:hypothetical protein BZG36_00730 [Bifiguratus adelaidae]|uniref:NTF2 domain-containing protein n=1 Tax=Bifiguratus adelaidae TaxID=1938954 RepID=A0A261Y6Z9_9FUNG|nr:hypothetical protein BZG36_00730 [Bifiguratus adelaidae]
MTRTTYILRAAPRIKREDLEAEGVVELAASLMVDVHILLQQKTRTAIWTWAARVLQLLDSLSTSSHPTGNNSLCLVFALGILLTRLSATPYGRARSSRPGGPQRPTRNSEDSKNLITIRVEGFAQGTDRKLMQFLQRKSRTQWSPLNRRFEGEAIVFEVQTPEIASSITKCNGFTFIDRQLTVTSEVASTPSSGDINMFMPTTSAGEKMSTIDTLRVFLTSRYNPDLGLLNLDNMAQDPVLKAAGIPPPGRGDKTSQIGSVIMKLASEMFGEVHTISMANNGFRDVNGISTLAQYHPSIQNLSLENNLITSMKGLEAISAPGKLKFLRELVLSGNPLKTNLIERGGDEISYRSEVTRRFPTLKVLDGVSVAPSISFDVQAEDIQNAKGLKLADEIKPSFFDNDGTKSAAYDFCGRYFSSFDHDRSALINFYDVQAFFSICVNTSMPPGRNRGTWKMQNFEGWIELSRNLQRFKDLNRRVATLQHGHDLQNIFHRIPQTAHDLTKADHFAIDAWQMGGFEGYQTVLFIMMHGEFKDISRNVMRSFDRTFIVAPAAPGTRPHAAGLPYNIISDELIVRPHVGQGAWIQ